MKNKNPLLPGFHLQTLHRTPRTQQQMLADKIAEIKQKTFAQIGACFAKYIPEKYLLPEEDGSMSRNRIFSKENTFWAFFSQVLDSDGGCKEVVRKFQAYLSLKADIIISSSTGAYCKARQNLHIDGIKEIFQHTANIKPKSSHTSIENRRVIVIDGTSASMPDSEENCMEWPLKSNIKPGCGFPVINICALFLLETGVLLSYKDGDKHSSEITMFREQWDIFKKNDIALADKGFCNYFDIAKLKDKHVDSVMVLKNRKPVKAKDAVKVLGKNDLLVEWKKPAWNKRSAYSKEEWKSLPETLILRQIKVTVLVPGFRTQEYYIITTLHDAIVYTPEALAALYFKRWDVELFFRDIKTTMGMDVLRCKTPDMIRKEILMHFIAYNCIRHIMCDAAKEADIKVRRISFKGTLQALRQWEPYLVQSEGKRGEKSRLLARLYKAITEDLLLDRPDRSEPRCKKRRPKNYQLLNKPRAEIKEIKHRSRYRAETA